MWQPAERHCPWTACDVSYRIIVEDYNFVVLNVVAVTTSPYEHGSAICYRPPAVAHAEVSLYKDWHGIVAIYACHTGYQFAAGGNIRTVYCIEEDVWSLEITDCERT